MQSIMQITTIRDKISQYPFRILYGNTVNAQRTRDKATPYISLSLSLYSLSPLRPVYVFSVCVIIVLSQNH